MKRRRLPPITGKGSLDAREAYLSKGKGLRHVEELSFGSSIFVAPRGKGFKQGEKKKKG